MLSVFLCWLVWFVSDLCDYELLSGRHGYLAVLESAVQCIYDADTDSDGIFAHGDKLGDLFFCLCACCIEVDATQAWS